MCTNDIKRCKKLSLQPMVTKNTEIMDTAFTVSVDLKGHGVSSGISADDRSKTIRALVNPKTKPGELNRPGHVFPLVAKDGGVLRRSGYGSCSGSCTVSRVFACRCHL